MITEILIPAFTTLFVVIDPPGLAPLFLGLTRGQSEAERRRTAVRACVTAICVLAVFAAFGKSVLGFLGIGMPAFRIAGGLMLFLIALEMLFEKRTERRARSAHGAEDGGVDEAGPAHHGDDVSIFPLGIPLIAGPGAIASMILLMSSHSGDYAVQAAIFAVMLSVVAVTFILFLGASHFERLTGQTFTTVITRVFGIILGALAVQFVLTGIADANLIVRP